MREVSMPCLLAEVFWFANVVASIIADALSCGPGNLQEDYRSVPFKRVSVVRVRYRRVSRGVVRRQRRAC